MTTLPTAVACHPHESDTAAVILSEEPHHSDELRLIVDVGTNAEIVLGNTYHLMLRPGAERVASFGGLHKFMNWPGPILTDSGGFQAMSLSELRKINENGCEFRSHIDGSSHFLSPERSIEIQSDLLGSDIAMQLDECVANPCEHAPAANAMRLSARWGERSKAYFGQRDRQSLFGIVQGPTYPDLRKESARRVVETGFDGYAIGGLAVGGFKVSQVVLSATNATQHTRQKVPALLNPWRNSIDAQRKPLRQQFIVVAAEIAPVSDTKNLRQWVQP